jgi:hypothetical protein
MTTTAAKIEVRHASMRHTDTLAAITSKHHNNASAGRVLADELENLIGWDHLSGDELRAELVKKLAQYEVDRKNNQATFEARGRSVDATVYADKS